MALTSLKITGYRGFEKTACVKFAVPHDCCPGSGLTIITGPNNSGKSSILECLRAYSSEESPSFSDIVRNASADAVSISFVFNDRINTLKSLGRGSSETKWDERKVSSKIFVLPSRRAFEPYFGKSDTNREDYIRNFMSPSRRHLELDNFSSRLFSINSSEERKRKFNQMLARVLGFKPNWTIDLSGQDQYYLKFLSEKHSHTSDGLGEGIVSLFSIIDSLYDSEPNDIIAIDEPELSLHPALQKRLADLFVHLSKDRQIIISTHSPFFVDLKAIQGGAKILRVIKEHENTKVYGLTDNSSKLIKRLSEGNNSNPHVFGLDARELFFLEDKIVLAEGQEDVIFLPKAAEQVDEEIEGNFFGWGVGGAGNIKHLCSILKDLGFKKVVAILDNDKKENINSLRENYREYLFYSIPADDVRTKEARKETAEVKGLLDKKGEIRKEYKKDTKKIFKEIKEYMA